MTSTLSPSILGRMRLAAQLLSAGQGDQVGAAVRRLVGVQGQDLRAAALAVGSRTAGLTEAAVLGSETLLRTWCMRGTVHVIDRSDRDWLHAVFAGPNSRRFEAILKRRGALELARATLPRMVEALERGPRSRRDLLAELGDPFAAHGPAVNVLVPWAVAQGRIVSTAGGKLTATGSPAEIEEEHALRSLGRRYLEGYGPASESDFAAWSGLPLTTIRRALELAGPLERTGDLFALEGQLLSEPPEPPELLLLAAFDTLMLGWKNRSFVIDPEHQKLLTRGGGMMQPTILLRGRVAGFWRFAGTRSRPILTLDWLRRPAARRHLDAASRELSRFLEVEVRSK